MRRQTIRAGEAADESQTTAVAHTLRPHMSQLNTTTPFTFLGHITCIPVSKLTSIDQSAASTAQTVSLLPGSTRSLVQDSVTQQSDSAAATSTFKRKGSPSHERVIKRRPTDTSRRSKFPAILYDLVTKCTSGAIGWSPDGRSIVIKYSLFREEYLQRVFKTANITSFVRQLNLYGFRKVAVSPLHRHRNAGAPSDSHTFANPHFTRDDPDLANITRPTFSESGKSKFSPRDKVFTRY